jgi:hypothetical protein
MNFFWKNISTGFFVHDSGLPQLLCNSIELHFFCKNPSINNQNFIFISLGMRLLFKQLAVQLCHPAPKSPF